MKSLISGVAVFFVITAPAVSFAQTNQTPVTRAEVRAQLLKAEKDGYSPLAWADYPYGEVQAAKFRAASGKRAAGNTSGYGSGSNGTSQSGDIAR